MLKIGMPTLIELDTLEENIKLCKSLGLDFIEINMNFPQYHLDQLDAKKLNALQQENGIFFTFHLAEDIDIGHLNKNIRVAYVQEVSRVLELMSQVDSKRLNMHLFKGIYVTLPNEKVYIYNKYKQDYLRNIAEFSKAMSDLIDDRDMTILLENTGICDVNYVGEAIDLMLKSHSFKLTWDIGHDHASGHRDQAFMMNHLEWVNHYHIHDAVGKINHLTLYEGEIDIDAFLNRAKSTNATVVFETKTVEALKTSVKRYRASV